MSCFRPLEACRDAVGGEVRIGALPGWGRPIHLPCGVCIGCKLDRGRAWSIRAVHEAMMWPSSVFVTLTYRDFPYADPRERLDPSLHYPDFQNFMKRLRKEVDGEGVSGDGSRPVRFLCAGEYGGQTGRPHYHALLFNVRFADDVRLRNGTGRSAQLEELWAHGQVVTGDVTAASAAYVAGYSLKKVHGRAALEHYEDVVDLATGEVSSRRPEFISMSRRPGIGAGWYEKYAGDLFPADRAVSSGKCWKVPRYYWEKFRMMDVDLAMDAERKRKHRARLEEILFARLERAGDRIDDSTPARLAVREESARRRSEFFGGRGL